LREAFSRARESARRLDRITVTCSLYEAALRAAGVPAEKLVRLPLGVDTKRFAPPDDARRALARREVGVPREAFCVGSFQKDGVGWGEGLEPKLIKGPDLLLEAVGGVRGRNLFVLLSGPARGYVVQGLKRLAIPFAHAGFVDARRMPPLYHALDAYAVTSREDGGPAALLEAMASGVPVVSTRVGLAADLIVGGRNGFVVEVGDAVGLAAALSRLKDDVELRRRLAGEAMATAQEYDWSRVARRCYTEVYLPLLGRDATGGAT
jgi:glycosyltransferase involved in cell wall biosynthesis